MTSKLNKKDIWKFVVSIVIIFIVLYLEGLPLKTDLISAGIISFAVSLSGKLFFKE